MFEKRTAASPPCHYRKCKSGIGRGEGLPGWPCILQEAAEKVVIVLMEEGQWWWGVGTALGEGGTNGVMVEESDGISEDGRLA